MTKNLFIHFKVQSQMAFSLMQELTNERRTENALKIKDFDAVDAYLIMAVFVILNTTSR